ncbi:sensor domain-containing protein [Streptomyces sp. NPDC087440]|uniref:sensor domain-containing protein n=1 Tax=Streptomyces sp. NPDC087440 TaxID=3365790 RepID=UPI0037F3CBAE
MDIAAQSQARAVEGRRIPGWREILREPFRRETWRRALYLVLAVPVSVLCVPLALVGGPVGRVQRTLRERVLGERFEVRERGGAVGVVYALAAVPLSLVAFVVTAYCWFVVVINLGYPLRPGGDPTNAWGGPTMAGAWAVHGIAGGVGFLLLTPWIAKGFTALQTRLADGLLGRDGRGRGRALGLAVGVVAVCGLLSVPIIHQL